MAKDATMDILFGLQETAETKIFDFLNPQLYNIEDMDSKDCMISLAFSGCYEFKSTREIDPARSCMFYIDGSPTEKPVLVVDAMFGQLVGVCVRKYLHRYDATYRIRYTGPFDYNVV